MAPYPTPTALSADELASLMNDLLRRLSRDGAAAPPARARCSAGASPRIGSTRPEERRAVAPVDATPYGSIDSVADRSPGRRRSMARKFHVLAVGAIASHHAIERAAGVGLPGEPFLGNRRAAVLWGGTFAAHLALAFRRGRDREGVVGFANGAFQALALQHYVDWPWQFRRGVPVITEAEGLPMRWLPAYNTALLTAIAASTAAVVTDRRRTTVVAHLLGLATLPLQLASARHHQHWLRTRGYGER